MDIKQLEQTALKSAKNKRYQLQLIAKKILTDPGFFTPEKREQYYIDLKEHKLLQGLASFDETVTKKDLDEFHNTYTHSICTCGRIPINGGSESDINYAKLKQNPVTTEVYVVGMQQCKSVWVCPVCAAKIAQRRIKEINEGFKRWLELGQKKNRNYTQIIVTFTIPHYWEQSLQKVRNILMTAKRKLKQQKILKRNPDFKPFCVLKKKYKISGILSGVECTLGRSGWHPHTHDIFFVRKELNKLELAQLQTELATAWIKACLLAGIKLTGKQKMAMLFHSVDASPAKTAAEYILKFGLEGIIDPEEEFENYKDILEPGWGAARELTLSHIKTGNERISLIPQKNQKGLTPWDFLRKIQKLPDDRSVYLQMGRLFIEYTKTFTGKRQLFWSKGFKDLLKLNDYTDEELIEQQEQNDLDYGDIPKSLWLWVLSNNYIGVTCHVAQNLKHKELIEWIMEKQIKQKRGIENDKRQTIKKEKIEFA